ncbi:2-oxo acid dehydrogenase subunit E2 [Jatrophihabitans telluris]|uniref:Dihydrolipoamide acetyltransferase component of pyruvate dehydrogenase complex n=1 Tax=Jatrophihabitans telluris TaxID=2038343 RepID=A0ABY4QV43_9ACTN|nr:2-oxo acid dehydrogenase subunit E2 [Jatrophihabitans telluris]UQX86992.1 2-oxo acid dehydrogenase subunit E2 [Jatrophihabitans telluris]
MNIEVTMPQLGETVAEGTITRWLRQVGDVITDQEPLLEISTDKVDTEVPAPGSGRLREIIIDVDATVAVGTVLAIIDSEPAAGAGRPAHRRHTHSPLIRRLAAEAGLGLDSLTGSGSGGRLTREDVALAARQAVVPAEASVRPAASSAPAVPAASSTPVLPAASSAPAVPSAPTASIAAGSPVAGPAVPMTSLRTVIADRMMQSLHTTAQLTTVVEVDVTRVVALRSAARGPLHDRLGVRLTLTAFFAKAALEGLRAMPVLNSSIGADGRSVVRHTAQHLGIAVDTDRGLMVPVLRDAGDLSLLGLSRRIEDVANRTRAGAITPDDLAGGTFTITNTGSRGALFDTPILVPGQVGILGIGAVVERPAVARQPDGQRVIAIRSMAYLALTYDHRLVDGADAARYLVSVKNRLEAGQFEPELS